MCATAPGPGSVPRRAGLGTALRGAADRMSSVCTVLQFHSILAPRDAFARRVVGISSVPDSSAFFTCVTGRVSLARRAPGPGPPRGDGQKKVRGCAPGEAQRTGARRLDQRWAVSFWTRFLSAAHTGIQLGVHNTSAKIWVINGRTAATPRMRWRAFMRFARSLHLAPLFSIVSSLSDTSAAIVSAAVIKQEAGMVE